MRGHVRKRRSREFIVDIGRHPITGRRRQKSKSGFATKREAESALHEFIRYIEGGAIPPLKRIALAAYLGRWLEYQCARGIRSRTLDGYEGYYRHTCEHSSSSCPRTTSTQVTAAGIHGVFRWVGLVGIGHAARVPIRHLLRRMFRKQVPSSEARSPHARRMQPAKKPLVAREAVGRAKQPRLPLDLLRKCSREYGSRFGCSRAPS